MRRYWLWLVLLAGSLAFSARALPNSAGVTASAPLGSVTTALVTIDNSGQPATTARLYEAWDTPTQLTAQPAPGPLRVALPAEAGPITPELRSELAAARDGQADMIVYLADQADLSSAAGIADWNARGAAVVDILQQHAEQTQAPLLEQLRQAGLTARSYWIVNAVMLKGDRALAESLAARPEVALVAANSQHALDVGTAMPGLSGSNLPAWGLSRIEAPSVWDDWGVRGAGITVANLDTGVAFTQTALLERYRGWSPSGVSHDYNWYDPAGAPPSLVPIDQAGHGTHTMGIMVGGAAGGYSALGVAPDARWIAVRGCPDGFCSDAALMAGAQWLLAPTDLAGHNPRPDLRPNVINNSWGQPGDNNWYTGYVTAWNAAGIFSAFAIGNGGLFGTCQSTDAPGNYANSFAVGATDANDLFAPFSSLGPTRDGRIKPDISAPGVAVPSSWPDGSVQFLSGTSMAAPHVAGVVALLWSANPTLIGDLATTERVLTSTAVARPTSECGHPGSTVPNNVYGWGRVDARQAVQQARVVVPWLALPPSVALPANGSQPVTVTFDGRQVSGPGTFTARILVSRSGSLTAIPVSFDVQPSTNTAKLSGRLVDLWHGAGVYGRIRVGDGPAVESDTGGYYTVTLPYGSYVLTATATGYFSATAPVSVTAPVASDFILKPDLPHIELSPPPISATLRFGQRQTVPITVSNDGTQPLSVTASVPPLDWVVDGASVPGASLYDLSSTKPVSLADDEIYTEPLQLGFEVPIYGVLTNRLYLSSNGWVTTQKTTGSEPFANCLPSGSLPPGSLAPFWADLDPSVGGKVRFAQVSPDTFVVSFEQVPPWREVPDPTAATYTFQLVIHASGEIEFRYGAMPDLPIRWSVGASFDENRGQRLACFTAPAVLSGTVWSLHNQPAPNLWLGSSPDGLSVAPGQSASLPLMLAGYGYVAWHPGPFTGILRLTTNDPGQATVDITATASVGAPSHQESLPVILH